MDLEAKQRKFINMLNRGYEDAQMQFDEQFAEILQEAARQSLKLENLD